MTIPPEPEPFFKWDPDGHQVRARTAARATITGDMPENTEEETARRRQAAKRWLLRWAWLLSTGVLVFGYLVLAALLAGRGSWLGA